MKVSRLQHKCRKKKKWCSENKFAHSLVYSNVISREKIVFFDEIIDVQLAHVVDGIQLKAAFYFGMKSCCYETLRLKTLYRDQLHCSLEQNAVIIKHIEHTC